MLDFDFDKVLEQSRENPVFYVQYAHARVASVLRKADEAGIAADDATLAGADLGLLNHESELGVLRKLAEWPRLVETAARTNEPHRVAFYLYELAGDFHGLWNKGNEVPELRFLQEGDAASSQAKIALARGHGDCNCGWPWYSWGHTGARDAITHGPPRTGNFSDQTAWAMYPRGDEAKMADFTSSPTAGDSMMMQGSSIRRMVALTSW